MSAKKLITSMMLGALMAVMLLIPSVAHAGLQVDLVPDEVEDALCEGLDDSTSGILSCEDYGEITSFTEFEGSFEPPDAEGYDSGLTRAKTAREFILNVTNFALSFLGLVAVAVIIYGGFLYVTAGGEEGQTEKGKKSIMYAIIGILVVLSSYAIVNTLITEAPGGGEDRDGGVYASGDLVTGEEIDVYNINTVSKELQEMATDYVDAYTTYSNTYTYIEYAETYEQPELDTVGEFWINLENQILGTDAENPIDEDDIAVMRNYLEVINDVANEVMDMVDRYSDTYEAAQDLEELSDLLLDNASRYYANSNPLIPTAYAYYEEDNFERYQEIEGLLTGVKEAANADFNEKIGEFYEILDSIEDLFAAGGANLQGITDLITSIKVDYFAALTGESRPRNTTEVIDNSMLRDVVADLGTLFSVVDNLEFVSAVISANVQEGNAPLVVSFNGLASYDPSDLTITDEQYSWDLDGDGNYETTGASVSATYDQVGTYRVGLRVSSQGDSVAPGQSYISVVVNPPDSNIMLTVVTKVGDEILLADYANGIIETSAKFTEEEGAVGLGISLEGTTDGNGDPVIGSIIDCGNGTQEYEAEGLVSGTCNYESEGTYRLTAEVTDVTGRQDRYIGDIIIASPAARILPSTRIGDIGTTFNFDGSSSTTDKGSIQKYTFKATSSEGGTIDLGSSPDVDYEFENPGEYTVSLTVSDGVDQATDTIQVIVESQAPIPVVDYEIPNLAQPRTVHLDASDSYDLDPNDTVSFKWVFDEDYEIVSGDLNSAEIVVKFDEPGDKNIVLEVSDQYTDEDIKKTSEGEYAIKLDDIPDVDLEAKSGPAYHLDEETGIVEVEFEAISDTAVAYEIDFGDGDSDVVEGTYSSTATFDHTYAESGIYYVELTAYDDDDNENTYTKKIMIGESDTPIAISTLEKDNVEISTNNVMGNVNTVFSFDASSSRNQDGSTRGLSYSWDFGDQTRSTEKKVSHTYEETGQYTVTLSVWDNDEAAGKVAEDSFEITVQEDPPEIYGLSYSIESDSVVTPVEVKLQVDADDPDGSIANYYWYYYDLTNTTKKLGTKITKTPEARLTISTNGTTGEEKEYGFAVEVTDQGGNTVSSKNELNQAPTLEVINGDNEAPVAIMTVNPTYVVLNDIVTLDAGGSYDPDGDDIKYVWDLKGDGFGDDVEMEDVVYEYVPDEIGCFDVRLKVIDSNSQATVSDGSTELCVESITSAPDAAFVYNVTGFEVEFENNSTVDEENGASVYAYHWDLDTQTDADGDGEADNDVDSITENPVHEYASAGSYTVKLTVYDNMGGVDDVSSQIVLVETDPPVAAFTYEADDLNVVFKDNSKPYEGTEIVSYAWDFDMDFDSDGDGDKTNDVDSTELNPAITYADYGLYTTKLTVMDSMNKEDYVTRTVELEEQTIEVVGYLNTSAGSSQVDNKVHLQGDSQVIDLYYGIEPDNLEGATCSVDKNVYYDTDGDGLTDNDKDLIDENCQGGTFSGVYYEKSWGLIVTMLTVEYGDSSYQVAKEIVFDDITMGATNVFPVTVNQGLMILIVSFSFALLGAGIYTVRRIN